LPEKGPKIRTFPSGEGSGEEGEQGLYDCLVNLSREDSRKHSRKRWSIRRRAREEKTLGCKHSGQEGGMMKRRGCLIEMLV